MAKANVPHRSFNGGEVSPLCWMRPDVAKVANGCKRLENCVIFPQGGIGKRSGTWYVAPTKDETRKARLFPFVFSSSQAYIVEMGHQYFRFFTNRAQVVSGSAPYEVASTYTEEQLPSVWVTQSADVLYIRHPSHPPRTLTRTSSTSWVLSDEQFRPPATYEAGLSPATTLTLAATTGTGVNATTGVSTWLASDVDRVISFAGGAATVTSVTSGTVAVVSITRQFLSLTAASGQWLLDGSPATSATPDKKAPVGATATITLTAAGFRPADVGKFVDINGGEIELTSVASSTSASGIIRSELSNITETGAGTWQIKSLAWTTARGYPATNAFHQERLWEGGTQEEPNRWWASRSADFTNLAFGTEDDAAIDKPLTADAVHTIKWMASLRKAMAIGTDSGAWLVSSGVSDPTITPTQSAASLETNKGAAGGLKPLRLGSDLIYVGRSRRKLYGLRYSLDTDSYIPADLTILADHVLSGGVNSIVLTDEPYSHIYTVREDGQMPVLTDMPEHDVLGWSRLITDGVFESVTAIPGEASDQSDEVWVIVRRTINGVVRRYVERLEVLFRHEQSQADTLFADCGLSGTSATPKTVWTGLDHLEGKAVSVVADGYPVLGLTVSDGSITLPLPASSVLVGLPYRAVMVPIDPDAGSPDGTTGSRRRRAINVSIYGYRSSLWRCGLSEDVAADMDSGPQVTTLDALPALLTGWQRRSFTASWDRSLDVTFVHDLPLPATMLSCAINTSVSES